MDSLVDNTKVADESSFISLQLGSLQLVLHTNIEESVPLKKTSSYKTEHPATWEAAIRPRSTRIDLGYPSYVWRQKFCVVTVCFGSIADVVEVYPDHAV